MRLILPLASTIALTFGAPLFARGGEACQAAAAKGGEQVIELAICLDTSGSMNGLIDAARAKIWDIVSDLATATPKPKLRVAIVQFGNDGLNPENGWTNVEVDLTDDLDLVSQRLFALSTNGGTELVGRVVDKATAALGWSTGESALRILVVAGNESADQDQTIRYADACKRAIERGILVNSIYCGSPGDGLAPAWKEVATLADGHFATIDQNNGTVTVETPFDAELVSLGTVLNTTYLPYGDKGLAGCSNQLEQDANAAKLSSSVAAQRAVTKGGSLYWNSGWDLVDACKSPEFKLEEVKAEELPEDMRTLPPEARRAYVEERAQKRDATQKRIAELNASRQTFIAEELAKRAKGDSAAFDRAMRDAIRAQAGARGFSFPPDPVLPAKAEGADPAPATAANAG